jgi:hypothetical protein
MIRQLGAAGALLLLAAAARGEDKVLKGLTEEELVKAGKDVLGPGGGWYPAELKGYAQGKESRFDVTFRQGTMQGGWYMYANMTAEVFAQRTKEAAKKGYTVAARSAWKLGAQPRYAVIWHNVPELLLGKWAAEDKGPTFAFAKEGKAKVGETAAVYALGEDHKTLELTVGGDKVRKWTIKRISPAELVLVEGEGKERVLTRAK